MKTKTSICIFGLISITVLGFKFIANEPLQQAQVTDKEHILEIFCAEEDNDLTIEYYGTGMKNRFSYLKKSEDSKSFDISAMHLSDLTKVVTDFSSYVDANFSGELQRDKTDRSQFKAKLNISSKVKTKITFLGIQDRSKPNSSSEDQHFEFGPGDHELEFNGKIIFVYPKEGNS